jgi:hypothetical protein
MNEANPKSPDRSPASNAGSAGISSDLPAPVESAVTPQPPAKQSYSNDPNHADATELVLRFPRTALVAGIIWIIVGSVPLVLAVAIAASMTHMPSSTDYALSFACLFAGGTLTITGIQTVSGTARSIVGAGVGSIVLGVLVAPFVIVLDYVLIVHPPSREFGLFGWATLVTASALGLFVAGILAAVGGTRYDRWRRVMRRFNNPGKRGV